MTRTWIGKESRRYDDPFPHIVIDGFIDDSCCIDVLKTWPRKSDKRWRKHACKKRTMTEDLPPPITSIIEMLSSDYFLSHLEYVFKLTELQFDDSLFGGGLHDMPYGAKVDMQVDSNDRPDLGMYRRVNAFLFLNRDWEPKHEGHLIFKDSPNGKEYKIAPLFNRLVAFKYSANAIHGVPEPLRNRRRSLACYYYTKEKPDDFEVPHSTIYEDV